MEEVLLAEEPSATGEELTAYPPIEEAKADPELEVKAIVMSESKADDYDKETARYAE
jgi:hypothetical protein